MTDSTHETSVVPAPTPPPAEQLLSAEEILDFDPAATVAGSSDLADAGSTEGAVPAPTPPAPAPAAPAASGADRVSLDTVCPSCGTTGAVDFARRDSGDFCRVCDFPLFWSRDRVLMPSADGPDESGLRRLPGTAGRAALASLLCPTCAEPNPATGVTCVRCGSPLHPVAAPEPVPVVVAAPAPVVEPEPDGRPWWPILLAGGLALVALTVVLVVLYA